MRVYVCKGFDGSNTKISKYGYNLNDNLNKSHKVKYDYSDSVESIKIHGPKIVDNKFNIAKYVVSTEPVFARNRKVHWSIVQGTDKAVAGVGDCDEEGILYVFPNANGTVKLRATCVDNVDVYAELTITVKSNAYASSGVFKGSGLLTTSGELFTGTMGKKKPMGVNLQRSGTWAHKYLVGDVVGNGTEDYIIGIVDGEKLHDGYPKATSILTDDTTTYYGGKLYIAGKIAEYTFVNREYTLYENGNFKGSNTSEGSAKDITEKAIRVCMNRATMDDMYSLAYNSPSKIGNQNYMLSHKEYVVNKDAGSLLHEAEKIGDEIYGMYLANIVAFGQNLWQIGTSLDGYLKPREYVGNNRSVQGDKPRTYKAGTQREQNKPVYFHLRSVSNYTVPDRSYGESGKYKIRIYGGADGFSLIGKNGATLSGLVLTCSTTLTNTNIGAYFGVQLTNSDKYKYNVAVAENVINVYIGLKELSKFNYTVDGGSVTSKSANVTVSGNTIVSDVEITGENVGSLLNTSADTMLVVGSTIKVVDFSITKNTAVSNGMQVYFGGNQSKTSQGCSFNRADGKLYNFYAGGDYEVFDLETGEKTTGVTVIGGTGYHYGSVNFDVYSTSSPMLYATSEDERAVCATIGTTKEESIQYFPNRGYVACWDTQNKKSWWASNYSNYVKCHSMNGNCDLLASIKIPSKYSGYIPQDAYYDKDGKLAYFIYGYNEQPEYIVVIDAENNKYAGEIDLGMIGEAEGITMDAQGNIIFTDRTSSGANCYKLAFE